MLSHCSTLRGLLRYAGGGDTGKVCEHLHLWIFASPPPICSTFIAVLNLLDLHGTVTGPYYQSSGVTASVWRKQENQARKDHLEEVNRERETRGREREREKRKMKGERGERKAEGETGEGEKVMGRDRRKKSRGREERKGE